MEISSVSVRVILSWTPHSDMFLFVDSDPLSDWGKRICIHFYLSLPLCSLDITLSMDSIVAEYRLTETQLGIEETELYLRSPIEWWFRDEKGKWKGETENCLMFIRFLWISSSSYSTFTSDSLTLSFKSLEMLRINQVQYNYTDLYRKVSNEY